MDCVLDRCRDCAYLVEGDDGKWVCSDYEKEVHEVADNDCELMKYHFWED